MIRLIVCGKLKEKWMKEGAGEYLKRLQAYDKVEVIETADEKAPESNSEAMNEAVIRIEGERMLKHIRGDEYVILLDLAGQEKDSLEMARFLQDLYDHSRSRIAFVIGGSLGVSDALKQRADFRWRLSRNTFPHQLCRIIVLEQIYRCFRINRNEPYHK